jgi:uncharacterized protein YutE (UPF0331/DUF86 family)
VKEKENIVQTLKKKEARNKELEEKLNSVEAKLDKLTENVFSKNEIQRMANKADLTSQ